MRRQAADRQRLPRPNPDRRTGSFEGKRLNSHVNAHSRWRECCAAASRCACSRLGLGRGGGLLRRCCASK
ncbi:hypothetical protein C882_0844 [Caenispirillum salinarum AK4]|uniref:Uncharacterized protein n=1 Tax=Caenispirillum salinarum AK4 TaxID=1238182 RepID=K9GU20_9PROT|nr:hypothetical protein C882_0844 [Caenispirillum salinarum AK4]